MKLSPWETIKFALEKKWKKHDTKWKQYVVVVELWDEEVQVEIIEPKDNILKFNLDDDIKWECEICIKEIDWEDSMTIFENCFTIK